jgi:glycosyltransferase 2 family protein
VNDQRSHLLRRLLVGGFLVGGTLAAGLALWAALGQTEGEVLPPVSRWVMAAGCAVVWLYTATRAWVALFEAPEQRRTLTGAMLLSQLGKYVPGGGLVQVTGMVAMSRNEHVSTSRLALGLPVIGLSVVAAGGLALAGLALADTTLPTWGRVLCLAGLAAPLVLWRPLMASVVGFARRFIRRLPPPDDLPSQRAILVSSGWNAVSLTATALGFAILVQPLQNGTDLASLVLVFMVAWTAGFLVLPLPGGVGVREAVLVGLIAGAAASSVGASVAHRVINIAVELAAVGLFWGYSRLAARRAA